MSIATHFKISSRYFGLIWLKLDKIAYSLGKKLIGIQIEMFCWVLPMYSIILAGTLIMSFIRLIFFFLRSRKSSSRTLQIVIVVNMCIVITIIWNVRNRTWTSRCASYDTINTKLYFIIVVVFCELVLFLVFGFLKPEF